MALGSFWVHGYPLGGENALCYKVLSKKDREKGLAELAAANAAIMGSVNEAMDCENGEAEASAKNAAVKASVDETNV